MKIPKSSGADRRGSAAPLRPVSAGRGAAASAAMLTHSESLLRTLEGRGRAPSEEQGH